MAGSRAPRVAVVGGGVSGLTAAYRLRTALGADAAIDVFESTDRLGGILRTVEVGGHGVDVGAEAFIVRRPEAVDLVTELGLADLVVSPTSRRPSVWARGGLHPLPSPALMGIPTTADAVAGVADDADLARISAEPDRPWTWDTAADPSVGDLVADRFGPSVAARSVDPMLGGVYSCLSADIGLREAIPALAARLDAGAPNLTAAVTGLVAAGSGGGPVFGTLIGGYRVLIDALVRAAAVAPRLETPVRAIHATAGTSGGPNTAGWTLTFDDASGAGTTAGYDGVVLALPAWAAAELLAPVDAAAGASLGAVTPASSAVVSLALDPRTPLPDHSGVLVATGEALRAKAFTFSSQKWAHLSDDSRPVSVRVSFGRHGDPVPDPASDPGVDARLVAQAIADLDEVCVDAGVSAPSTSVLDSVVQHWPGGLPVYAPGHLAVMRAVLESRPAGVVLAGAAYNGVGVPACIGRASTAVNELLADLRHTDTGSIGRTRGRGT